MRLSTGRAKMLDAYIAGHPDQEIKDERIRVTLAGEVNTLKSYKIPISMLIFNIRNGRFAAELLGKEDELNRKLDPTAADDATIIKSLLLTQNEEETKILKEDLKVHGQIEPGIITFDGAVINANRRMAILSTLFTETRDTRFEYLRVGRLPERVDEKDLWRIEAKLQFARDFRLEYGPVNELLKLKEGRDRGLSAKDISHSLLGRYSEKKVEEKLEILKLIEGYLKSIGHPNEYNLVQTERNVEKFNSLQSNVVASLRRANKRDARIPRIIGTAFALIEKTNLSHWDIRKLKKIVEIPEAYKELMTIYEGKKSHRISKEALTEAFKSAAEIMDDREERDKPERLMKKALSALSNINLKSGKLYEAAARGLLRAIIARVAEIQKVMKKS